MIEDVPGSTLEETSCGGKFCELPLILMQKLIKFGHSIGGKLFENENEMNETK